MNRTNIQAAIAIAETELTLLATCELIREIGPVTLRTERYLELEAMLNRHLAKVKFYLNVGNRRATETYDPEHYLAASTNLISSARLAFMEALGYARSLKGTDKTQALSDQLADFQSLVSTELSIFFPLRS